MTNEEKARAYEEALEWMRRSVYPTLTGAAKEDAEHFFPALKESEDEKMRKHIIDIIKDNAKSKRIPCDAEIAYLERQKDSKVVKFDHDREQKPVEWSDKDKAMLKVAIAVLRRYSHDDVADWLKSLRPQPHWKPSEEQMEALERASTNEYLSARQYDILVSLYEQLTTL